MTDIRSILKDAEKKGASDVHICVDAVPKYRIHGKLTDSPFQKTSASDTLAMLLSIINEDQRECFEQKGEIDISVSVSDGRFRVNAYKQRGAISLAIRIVHTKLPEIAELSIPESILRLTERNRGLVFISGPAGAGKSTVMASVLDRINTERQCNIITLEDPIEYLHTHKNSVVNQKEIGIDSPSYEEALRSAMREDPDVIYVSSVKSAKSIELMLDAVEMGKLVFAASSKSSAEEVIKSIISVFSKDDEIMIRNRLASALEGVMARKLIHDENGVRKAACEVLLCDKEVKEAIVKGNYDILTDLIRNGHDKGMFTMDESVYTLYKSGAISAQAAVSSANDPDLIKRAVSQNPKG